MCNQIFLFKIYLKIISDLTQNRTTTTIHNDDSFNPFYMIKQISSIENDSKIFDKKIINKFENESKTSEVEKTLEKLQENMKTYQNEIVELENEIVKRYTNI